MLRSTSRSIRAFAVLGTAALLCTVGLPGRVAAAEGPGSPVPIAGGPRTRPQPGADARGATSGDVSAAAAIGSAAWIEPVNGGPGSWDFCDPGTYCLWEFPQGTPIVLQVAVGPAVATSQPPVPTGTVTVYQRLVFGTMSLGAFPLANGLAQVTVPVQQPSAGTVIGGFTASYSGDANYAPGSTFEEAFISVVPAGAPRWQFETLDGPGLAADSITGLTGLGATSVRYGDSPQVFYYDQTNGNLRHAWYSGGWRTETLDGVGGAHGRIDADVGRTTTAIVYGGQLQVFYDDATNGALRHAWWNGVAWQFETLDGVTGAIAVGATTSDVGELAVASSYGIQVHAYYFDRGAGSLRHAWWNGVQWGSETIDGVGGLPGHLDATVGEDVDVTLYQGVPHAWYYDRTNGNLRHAWWDANLGRWRFENLDGDASLANGHVDGDLGSGVSVAMFSGGPHVWYYDRTSGALRHAWWNGAAWGYEDLDGFGGWEGQVIADVGDGTAVALVGDSPHVWYPDRTNGYLRHGWWNGVAWQFEAVDGFVSTLGTVDGDVGLEPTALELDGVPHVWYGDVTNTDLRHAWFG